MQLIKQYFYIIFQKKTLDYAYCAKKIKNRPIVNQKKSHKLLIDYCYQRIDELNRLIKNQQIAKGVLLKEDEFKNLQDKLDNFEKNKRKLDKEISKKQSIIEESKKKKEKINELSKILDSHINEHKNKTNKYVDYVSSLEKENNITDNDTKMLKKKYQTGLHIITQNLDDTEIFQKDITQKYSIIIIYRIYDMKNYVHDFIQNEDNKYKLIYDEIQSFCSSSQNVFYFIFYQDISTISSDLSAIANEISIITNNSHDTINKSTKDLIDILKVMNNNVITLNNNVMCYKIDMQNEKMNNNIDNIIDEQSQLINNCLEELNESFKKELKNYQKELQDIQIQQNGSIDVLINTIKDGMNNLTEKENKFWPNLSETSKNIIERCIDKISNNKTTISNSINSINDNISKYANITSNILQKESKSIDNHSKASIEDYNKLKSINTKINQTSDQFTCKIDKSKVIKNNITKINQIIENLSNWTIEDQFNEIPTDFQNFSNNLNEKCNKIINDMDKFMNEYKVFLIYFIDYCIDWCNTC